MAAIGNLNPSEMDGDYASLAHINKSRILLYEYANCGRLLYFPDGGQKETACVDLVEHKVSEDY